MMANTTTFNQTHTPNNCDNANGDCTTSQPQHVQAGLIVGLVIGILALFIMIAMAVQHFHLQHRRLRRSDSLPPEPMQQQQPLQLQQAHQRTSSTDSHTSLTRKPSPVPSLHRTNASIHSQPVSALSRQPSQISSVHQASILSDTASPSAVSPVTDRATAFTFPPLSVPQRVEVRRSVVDMRGVTESGDAVDR